MFKTLITATALIAATATHADEKKTYAGVPGVRSYGEIVKNDKRKQPRVNTTYREITSFDTVNSCYHGLTQYC